jgi:hypothetical protein
MRTRMVSRIVALGCSAVVALGPVACQAGGAPTPGQSASAAAGSLVASDDFVAMVNPIDRAMLDTSGITWKALPAGATLVGPHVGLRFARIGTLSEVTQAQRTMLQMDDRSDPDHPLAGLDGLGTRPLHARSGHEFVLIDVVDGPVPGLTATGLGTQLGDASAALVIAGQTRPVGISAAVGTGELALAVIPAGAPVSIAVTDSGRTQTLDLRTGKRAGDAIAGYYPLLSGGRLFEELIHINGVDKSGDWTLLGTGLDVRLQPYIDGKGWAAPGRAWLTIDFDVSLLEVDTSITVDVSKSLTLHGPGGSVLRLPAGTRITAKEGSNTLPFGTGALAIDVPASLRRLTATYTTNATITKVGSSTPLSWTRRSRSTSGTIQLVPNK